MDIRQKIQYLAEELLTETIQNRRYLHAHPELSFQEKNTSTFVQQKLQAQNIPFQANVGGYGIVAYIQGKNPTQKVIALRADMDALPITEANQTEYTSQNVGVMHACGHDAHTANLLSVAAILNKLKTEFEGTVKLIFQPAEEKIPGGASLMIQEGVLENPKPQAIIGQHVMPLIETGKVGFRAGKYMASADEIYVTIQGKGGHGAQPHQCIDPVLIASHIIVALQQIVSRNAPPTIPSVLTFGKVIANGATNVIPNQVYMEGTFRTMDEKWRAEAHQKMKSMAEGMAQAMGAKCEFNIVKGYPVLYNHEALTNNVKEYAIEYLGKENVIDLDLWMAAEDFAYYTHQIPGCFYRLGTRNEQKGIISNLHTPTFDIDEQALQIGVGLMAYITIKCLSVQ
ncbi:MAG: M20 family metallopeptidase [Bacteroidia bacterium]|nr:M20 family metallopeptidase [Bacteroidia bacterium]